MNKISVSHLSNAHSDNLRAIDFYKQELQMLKGRLTEVAGKNTDSEMARQVEHFENQFSIQDAALSKIAHGIHANLTKISAELKANTAGYIEVAEADTHQRLIEDFVIEERMFNDLKHGFNRFAGKWM
jgi:hypothetical protein